LEVWEILIFWIESVGFELAGTQLKITVRLYKTIDYIPAIPKFSPKSENK
jgi:hypothetical protein